ncbi:hypothetical protein COCMIDRAFT_79963 [Bipolaris oryzae ATCC 44560]|uniref:Autophagy-related protein 16 domain-containing protein n=1 Tax=Bipolaris oryzae ATCC 44560 TaxID=930090 RepID=W6ZLW3_COCMI|nr:uncharacterized protein COCMIDRAFT_79963 [Bipolaris oryzae ATCC 44560]EUC51065.1 hypothetical protein COCMIDRAFT_79963 [Bipolaris oryzae ATCC 44560]
MSNPLEDYLAALDARDAREKAHEAYVNAYTKLADGTASLVPPAAPAEEPLSASASLKALTYRGKGKAKGSATTDPAPSSTAAQLRAELAATQRTRGDLEARLSATSAELFALKTTETEQRRRIEHLEKTRRVLERRARDTAEELKGKGRLVEDVHDEMVALNLQLNMAEQEKEKLRKENDELTKRWVKKMEEEAKKMNERSGWGDQSRRIK